MFIRKLIYLIVVIIYFGFLLLSLRSLYFGGIAFWNDPARDLLSAWENIYKISLIGQPSGIPGIFYGPYWIWFLSLGLLVSKNPAIVAFLILTIPYFTIFPLILFKLKKMLGVGSLFILITFYSYFLGYTNSIWNPHLSSLIILGTIFCVYKNVPIYFFILGALTGLLMSFHFSIFVALSAAGFIYVCWTRNLKNIILYNFGLFLLLLPTVIFEFRHGFNQLNIYLNALTNSIIYNRAIVLQTGLSQVEILKHFYWVLPLLAMILLLKKRFGSDEIKPIAFTVLVLFMLVFTYFSTKNPVWEYHFMGFEILYIFLISLIISRFKIVAGLTVMIVSFVALTQFGEAIVDFPPKYYLVPGLGSKEKVVRMILDDVKDNSFQYFAYNSGIYTYDYDYLFRWLSNSRNGSKIVYLIIPPVSLSIEKDFVNYRTSNYTTEWEKVQLDGTKVIKRVL